MGIETDGECLNTILFAVHLVVIANDEEYISYMTRKLVEELDRWWLNINTQKTEYLTTGSQSSDLQKTDNVTLKSCRKYK